MYLENRPNVCSEELKAKHFLRDQTHGFGLPSKLKACSRAVDRFAHSPEDESAGEEFEN